MAEPWCRHLTKQDHIGCVGIVGGTHGNERNGVYLGRNYAKIQGPSGCGKHKYNFEIKVIESNIEATKKNLRYVDEDLNRQFTCKDLEDPDRVRLYEHRRAKEINAILGPKTSPTPVCDFVLDFHNTTAATGVALFLHPRDKFSQELAAYLISVDPSVHVALWADRDVVLLPSVGRSGMTFEVGPVSIGCLDARLYQQSKRLTDAALTYMSAHNTARKRNSEGSTAERRKSTLECIQMIKAVPFPRDEDKELAGMIHPNIDGKDFSPLKPDDVIFSMFDGSEKTLKETIDVTDDVVYPFLVNETSYYEKDIAFVIGRHGSDLRMAMDSAMTQGAGWVPLQDIGEDDSLIVARSSCLRRSIFAIGVPVFVVGALVATQSELFSDAPVQLADGIWPNMSAAATDLSSQEWVTETFHREDVIENMDYVTCSGKSMKASGIPKDFGGLWWMDKNPAPEVVSSFAQGKWTPGLEGCRSSKVYFYTQEEKDAGTIKDLHGNVVPCRGRLNMDYYDERTWAWPWIAGIRKAAEGVQLGSFLIEFVCGGEDPNFLTICKVAVPMAGAKPMSTIWPTDYYMVRVSPTQWIRYTTGSWLKYGQAFEYYLKQIFDCDGRPVQPFWDQFNSNGWAQPEKQPDVFGYGGDTRRYVKKVHATLYVRVNLADPQCPKKTGICGFFHGPCAASTNSICQEHKCFCGVKGQCAENGRCIAQ